MRIAYVALGIEHKNMAGGVGRKLHTQIALWTEARHAPRLFALVPNSDDRSVFTYRGRSGLPLLGDLERLDSRTRALGRIIEAVRAFAPDVVYLRTGVYLYPSHRLADIAPLVMELNTNDIAQRQLKGAPAYWLNLLTRDILLRRAAGLVAVTREIARMAENRKFGTPSRVVGNGIDLQQYEPLSAPAHANPVITMVGSAGMSWHGVDKLIRLAGMCSDLRINIVGYADTDLPRPLPPNVRAYGFLDAAGVRSVLQETDVACGSLALHRNRMQEGSTLKVPEALAYGIPVLLAYRDTDLAALRSDCILELPNAEDNVVAHADRIHDFAWSMMGRRLSREEIAPCIDQRAKEEQRLAFFAEVLKRSRHGFRPY